MFNMVQHACFILDFKTVCLLHLQCISRIEESHILAPACAPGVDDDNFLSFPFPEQLCRVMLLLSNSMYIDKGGLPFAPLYSLNEISL